MKNSTRRLVFAFASILIGISSIGASCQLKKGGATAGMDGEASDETDESLPTYDVSKEANKLAPADRVAYIGQPRKKILVMNFWNDTPLKSLQSPDPLGQFSASELKRGLLLTDRVIIPEDLQSSFSTEDLVQEDRVNVGQLIREGRRTGVAAVVVGRISRVVFRQNGDSVGLIRKKQSLAAVELEAKIFDIHGGREILATIRSGETSTRNTVVVEDPKFKTETFRNELTKAAIQEAAAALIPDVLKAVEKLTWQGRIAKIAGQEIYINAGKQSGLNGGDILRVLSSGDDIYDPVTGALLGRSPGKLKGTLEVRNFLGNDGAMSKIHSGGNFREGDLVQLY